jgi:hypothetical protein
MNTYFDNVIDNQLALSCKKFKLSKGAEYHAVRNIVEKCCSRSQPRGRAYHKLLIVELQATFK